MIPEPGLLEFVFRKRFISVNLRGHKKRAYPTQLSIINIILSIMIFTKPNFGFIFIRIDT